MNALRQAIKNIAVVRVSGMNHHYPTAQMPLTDDRIDAILDAVIAALPEAYSSDLYRNHPVDMLQAYRNKIIAILEAARDGDED
jgi:hypothetical protein